MSEKVWVELVDGTPVRICRTFTGEVHLIDRRVAVGAIRHAVFVRSKGQCEWCNETITERGMHLHEQVSRGNGGEISLSNSVGICADCHLNSKKGHGKRKPQFTRRKHAASN